MADSRLVLYGSTLEAAEIAERFDLALLEPSFDLLARLPASLLLRTVGYGYWSDVALSSTRPVFLKPADPLDKPFDAGVYRGRGQVASRTPLSPDMPILWAEPVEWLAEYRCFVLEGRVVATSPYLSFGRPFRQNAQLAQSAPPPPVLRVCSDLMATTGLALPPAFVVDIGLIDDRGWAVVEFNPAWCSSLLSADPDGILDVLQRACRRRNELTSKDRNWARPKAGSNATAIENF